MDAPPYRFATLVGVTVFLLYLVTLAPTTQFWDTSEYIAAAKVLGIPHPPGNPLFVLVGHVWGMLPLTANYALRINLFSAACSAFSSALLFLVAERFLRGIVTERGPRLLAAFSGVMAGAASFTVWNQSVVNAKVYTFSLLSIALVLWLTVRMGDVVEPARKKKLLLIIAYSIALGSTNHLMALLIGPAVAVYILWDDRRLLFDWRVIWGLAAVTIVGLSVFLFLRIRAPLFPPINEGEPGTWGAWWDVIMRKQFAKPPVTERQADFLSQLANFWQYFSWQFARDFAERLRQPIALIFAATGLYGGWRLLKTDRRAGLTMLTAMFTMTIALVFYLNFKYGFSMDAGDNALHEVRERDYFFVASFQLLGVWLAVGMGSVMAGITRALRYRIPEQKAWTMSTAILTLGLMPMIGNRMSAPRSGETLARDFAFDLLASVEPYSILITAGDNDLFPLWYAQEVEGVRRDVLVANLSLMGTPWHLRQLQRRETFNYEPAERDIWAGGDWQAPERQPFALTMEGLDSLPPAVRLGRPASVPVGNLTIELEAGIITRSDLAVVQLIRDNLGIRPIYFATTTGGFADRMGMGAHLLSNGLSRRLLTDPIIASDTVYRSGVLGWINVPIFKRLAFDVYHAESAARDRPMGWIDRPSASVPTIYGLMYSELVSILSDSTASPDADSQLAVRAGRARRIAGEIARNLDRANR